MAILFGNSSLHKFAPSETWMQMIYTNWLRYLTRWKITIRQENITDAVNNSAKW